MFDILAILLPFFLALCIIAVIRMVVDALDRNESCGGHFREEYQTPDGEALRRDDEYAYVSAWEFKGADQDPVLHKEMLHFDNVELKTRSYK